MGQHFNLEMKAIKCLAFVVIDHNFYCIRKTLSEKVSKAKNRQHSTSLCAKSVIRCAGTKGRKHLRFMSSDIRLFFFYKKKNCPFLLVKWKTLPMLFFNNIKKKNYPGLYYPEF